MALRILVVEDDSDTRDSLVMLLDLLGHAAIGADSVASGRQELCSRTFDVALIDFTLPDGDGAELARAASVLEPRPHVLGLTGWTPSSLGSADHAAFDRVVQKPLRTDDLTALLAELEHAGVPR